MDDAELLRRSASGDEAAFEVLYHRHRNMVFRFAWVLMKSETDAEDVVQECFITLIRKARGFDPHRAQLRTWLLGITRNPCYRRAQRNEPWNQTEAADIRDENPGPEGRFIVEETNQMVRRAVMSLPRAQREAIVLFEFEEMSLAEVGRILGVEPNAVKARLHRARETLKTLARLSKLLEPKSS